MLLWEEREGKRGVSVVRGAGGGCWRSVRGREVTHTQGGVTQGTPEGWIKGTVSRDFLIRFMTLKTKSVLFVQALIV